MRAMVLEAPGQPLRSAKVPVPRPGPGQLLLRVHACGVCRTDLHIVDGDLPMRKCAVIPGHEIVGEVAVAAHDGRFRVGDRVGVPWLGSTDGTCVYCRKGLENLCESAEFTGYTRDGGYAEYAVADDRYCLPLPDRYDALHAAPLLCAGVVGYRAYRMAGDALRLGLYGFGASAHILTQVALHEGREVYAFTRPGDVAGQAFARQVGAVWAGGSTVRPPVTLDAAILFAPVGALVVEALRSVDKGAPVVCAGIHMTDIPSFAYRLLWEERAVRSVANLTREDGEAFMRLAARVPLDIRVHRFSLEDANGALESLRSGALEGVAVLTNAPAGQVTDGSS